MWTPNRYASSAKKGVGNGLVAVAIDKDKGSQHALRWAVENLLSRGQTVILIHVVNKAASVTHVASNSLSLSQLLFQCLCPKRV